MNWKYALGCMVVLPACVYSPPEDSGLVPVRPYPTSADVCQVVGENEMTQAYLDDSATLIACPNHERGAINDRLSEGGQIVGPARKWTLISIPVR